MVRSAIIGITAIVVISVLAVLYINSLTGAYTAYDYELLATSSYYTPHLYGGAIKRAMAQNPYAFGTAYGNAASQERAAQKSEENILLYQQYLYDHKDKWDCSFGKEAETSPWPCVFDDAKQKYCCIVVH